jgi:hypothetical protein
VKDPEATAVPRKKSFEFTWSLKEFSSLKWLGFRARFVGCEL